MIFSHFQAKTSIKYIIRLNLHVLYETKQKQKDEDNNNKQTKTANQTRPLPKRENTTKR